MKYLVIIFLCVLSVVAKSQIYNPTFFNVSNNATGYSQKTPSDGRSMYFNNTYSKFRDFASRTEVVTYFTQNKFKFGHYPVFIHSGGTLQNDTAWIGGKTEIYLFRDSTDLNGLVYWNDVQSVNGRIGVVIVGNADSIRGKTVDTSVASGTKNNYLLTYDSINNKWKLTAPASAYTAGTGISIASNVISALNTSALWNAVQIRSRSVTTSAPSVGQILKWSGTSIDWSDDNSSLDTAYLSGYTLYLIGTNDTVTVALNDINIGNGDYNIQGDTTGSIHFSIEQTGTDKRNVIDINVDSVSIAANNIHYTQIVSKPDSLKLIYNNNATGRKYIKIDTTAITVTDPLSGLGMVYEDDYSANGLLNDRWIPDIAAVRHEIGDSSGNYIKNQTTPKQAGGFNTSSGILDSLRLLSVNTGSGSDSVLVKASDGTVKKVAQSSISGATNLSYTQNATNNVVNSSTGTGATLLPATTSLAGLLDTARVKYIDSAKSRLNIPSWNQTLAVNDTTRGDLNFDTTLTVPSPGSAQKYWMRFQPLAKGEGSPPFLWTQNAQHYSGVGQADNTMAWGWNINPGGGQEVANQPGIGYSLEQRYIPVVGDTNTEAHLFYITKSGAQQRLFSYTVKEYLGDYDYYITSSRESFKNPNNLSHVWQSFSPGSFTMRPYSGGYYFNIDQDSITGTQFTISNPSSARAFILQNYTSASFPGLLSSTGLNQFKALLLPDIDATYSIGQDGARFTNGWFSQYLISPKSVGGTGNNSTLTLCATGTSTPATGADIIFRNTTDISGIEIARMTNAGKLGIGTTSPLYKISLGTIDKGFDTFNSDQQIKVVNNYVGATFGVQNSSSSGYSGIEYLDNTGTSQVFSGYNNGSAGEFRFNNFSSTNPRILFKLSGSDVLSVTNTNKVGVRKSNPLQALHVGGQVQIDTLTNGTAGTDSVVVVNNGVLKKAAASNYFALPSLTSGSVLFSNGTTIAQDNSNFFWDNTNDRLGIGTASPTARLHLPAGLVTASSAPLKFENGTLNITAEPGAVEYSSSHYFTKASGLRMPLSGTIVDFYTDAPNTGTGETDIYSFTTPARTLDAVNEKLKFTFTLNLTDITATAQVKIYFAGTLIGNTGALTVSATGSVIIQGWIIRTGSSTARASVNISSPTASTAVYTSQTDLTGLTFTNTNIIKCTAQAGGAGGGNDDIVGKMGTVEWQGVPVQ